MSYSYQFRLKIIKLVTEQDYGIREVAKLHKISHALVIYWLKAFRERGLDGVKSPHTNLQTPKIVKSKMKKKDIEIPETTDFSPMIAPASTLVLLNKTLRILPINVGRTNVQNPLDFVTALLVDRHKRGRLRHRGRYN